MNKKNALLMAYDKAGIADFARGLISLGYAVYGSKGTVEHLAKDGVQAIDIAGIVGEPILGHRVVSLSL
jgi:phosphoribosylaminoimidazolecarboxamide formyltransferase/IMP cyclohydrolase